MQMPYDKETIKTEKKSLERRHSHRGIVVPNVIDQLRIKVKRKRLSKANSFDLSDSTAQSNNKRNSISSQQSSQVQNEISPVSLLNYKSVHTPPLETIISCNELDSNAAENADTPTEIDDSTAFNSLERNEDSIPGMGMTSLPIEINQKFSQQTTNPIKAWKSLPESGAKKRRQTLRRTGFQIRDEDFSIIFSDLSVTEQFIIGYPCAWRKEVFMHGRMFLTMNYICFYTCFFKWEESLCVAFKDIVSVTREKSAVVISNAIKIRTKSNEQYLFASYVPREKIFIPIFRLWQNALLEQPLDYQQLRTLILPDQQTIDELTDDSEESNHSKESPELIQKSSSISMTNNSNEGSLRNHRQVNYLSICPCESHLTRNFADQITFTFNVDTLFELLFENNSFTQNYHSSQNLNDFNYGKWILNKDTGCRERLVTYRTVTQALIGSNALTCREKQILKFEKPGSIYVLYSEVNNEGIKYADTFYVATQFCMIQEDSRHSSLRVTAEIRYVKSVNSLIKTFIEKNAYSTIEEQVNEQVRRLTAQDVKMKSNRKQKSPEKQQSPESNISMSSSIQNNTSNNLPVKTQIFTGQNRISNLILCMLVFLLFVHIYLCYKLYLIDRQIITPEEQCLEQCRQSCLTNSLQ